MMQERQRPPVAGNPGMLARGWIVAILVVACLTPSPAAGDGWIMADAVNGSAVCPAHCLTVNQTAAGRGGSYRGQIVGFAPCSAASAAQIWSHDPGSQTISIQQPRLGIPACLGVQSNSSGIFLDACASPAPRTQLWRIDEGNASFASLAFFPEKVLGMTVTAGRLSWRDAVLLGGPGDGKDYRSVMSLVSPVPALDAASAPLPVRGNLISNGGFERCSYDVTEASLAVTLSTKEFFGPCFWNIGDGRVQIFGPGREIVEGNLALALGGGTLSGSVSQALSTEPQLDYLLSFLMSANSSCGGDVKRMEVTAVSFGLQFASTQSFNSSGFSAGDMGWTLRLLQFTATDSVTNVSFRSLEEDACGPLIDDVRVQPFLLALSPALQPRAVCDCGFWGGAGAIIGAAVAAFCAGFAVFAFWYVASRKPKNNSGGNSNGNSSSPIDTTVVDTTIVDTTTRNLDGRNGPSSTSRRRLVFSYDEISRATRGFSTGLGMGTRALAYVATLEPERIRAVVKREYRTARLRDQEFMEEVAMLLQVDHRNLVRFLGFCKDQGEHILVYEYMEGGSLHDRLHSDSNPGLTWTDRTKIARDVAAGLEYLHHGASPSILHGNLSSHNVLLTARLHAKIMDFGSARSVQNPDQGSRDHRHAATAAYMDPVVLRNEATYTKKSDVFSFGVLLLELLTGLEAARVVLEAREYLTFKDKMQQLLDPKLEGRIFPRELEVLIEVAQKCMQHSEEDRPSMHQLCKLLEDTAAAPSGEIQPAPTVTRTGAP